MSTQIQLNSIQGIDSYSSSSRRPTSCEKACSKVAKIAGTLISVVGVLVGVVGFVGGFVTAFVPSPLVLAGPPLSIISLVAGAFLFMTGAWIANAGKDDRLGAFGPQAKEI